MLSACTGEMKEISPSGATVLLLCRTNKYTNLHQLLVVWIPTTWNQTYEGSDKLGKSSNDESNLLYILCSFKHSSFEPTLTESDTFLQSLVVWLIWPKALKGCTMSCTCTIPCVSWWYKLLQSILSIVPVVKAWFWCMLFMYTHQRIYSQFWNKWCQPEHGISLSFWNLNQVLALMATPISPF